MILANHGIISSSGGALLPIVTTNLILHYDAGNVASYPGSGTLLYDLSPTTNTASLYNGVSYNSNYGGALVFDGVLQFVEPVARPSITNQITLETWCNLDTVISNDKWLVGVEESYRILYNGTSFQFVVRTTNNMWYSPNTYINYSTTAHINNNCHVVATYNSSRLKLYFNGVLQVTSSANISGNLYTNTNPYTIIKDGSISTGVDYGKGKIYQNRIYNVALSDADVLNNFNANKSKFGL